MTKLIRWETPFTEARCPSVGLLITSKGIEVDILKAVVAPGGIDEYPKYLVDFGRVIAFTCFEEAHSPERDFGSAEIGETGLCAYRYLDSPWLQSYVSWQGFLSHGRHPRLFRALRNLRRGQQRRGDHAGHARRRGDRGEDCPENRVRVITTARTRRPMRAA